MLRSAGEDGSGTALSRSQAVTDGWAAVGLNHGIAVDNLRGVARPPTAQIDGLGLHPWGCPVPIEKALLERPQRDLMVAFQCLKVSMGKLGRDFL